MLAGDYDSPVTRAALDRLGLRVETFPIETSFADVRANVTRMGALLGREARAAALVAAMDRDLASPPPAGPAPRAALFYANAYTSGAGTLAHEILTTAGFRNIAAERGVTGLARLPLEVLVLEAPDLARHRPGLRHPGAGAGRAAPPGRARRSAAAGRRSRTTSGSAARRWPPARSRPCAPPAMTDAARLPPHARGPRRSPSRCCFSPRC